MGQAQLKLGLGFVLINLDLIDKQEELTIYHLAREEKNYQLPSTTKNH